MNGVNDADKREKCYRELVHFCGEHQARAMMLESVTACYAYLRTRGLIWNVRRREFTEVQQRSVKTAQLFDFVTVSIVCERSRTNDLIEVWKQLANIDGWKMSAQLDAQETDKRNVVRIAIRFRKQTRDA